MYPDFTKEKHLTKEQSIKRCEDIRKHFENEDWWRSTMRKKEIDDLEREGKAEEKQILF